jgi:hypothetical protein
MVVAQNQADQKAVAMESEYAAPTALAPNLNAYPQLRLRVRSPRNGLTCGRAAGARSNERARRPIVLPRRGFSSEQKGGNKY